MKNEEVQIVLTSDVKSFKNSITQCTKQIRYVIQDMTDFNAMVDNANKKQLRVIASGMRKEIKDANDSIKEMQQELLSLTTTHVEPQGIGELRQKLGEAFTSLKGLKEDLEELQSTGGSPNAINDTKKAINYTTEDIQKLKDEMKRMYEASNNAKNTRINELRHEINDTAKATSELKARLEKVYNAGGMNIFQKSLQKIKNGFNGLKESASTFGKRISRIAFSSLIFRGLSLIRQGFSNAMELVDGADSKFSAMSNSIAGVLVPVVEIFTKAIQKAFVWVSGLVNFLTGGKINLIQKGIDATNKKIQKIGSTSKSAGKSVKDGLLGGLDEINNIETSSGGSGSSASGGQDMSVQIASLGELNSMLDQMNSMDFSWAQPVKDILNFIKENGEVIAIILGGLAIAIGIVNVAMWVMSVNPIVLTIAAIVLGITALIAVIVLCIKHWDKISETVSNVVNSIVEWVKGLVDKIVEWFNNLFSKIDEIFTNIWLFIIGIFESVINWVRENWSTIVSFLINPLAGVFKYLYEHCEGFRNFINKIIDAIKGFFTNLWDNIKNGASSTWNGIKNVFSTVGAWFSNIFTGAWEGIKKAFGKVTSFFQGIWDSIKSIFSNVGKVIGDAITNTVKKAINTVLSTAVKIINGFISAINLAINVINAIPGVNIKKLDKLSVPSFDVGTNYVPEDMLAMVHKGERIVPEKYNNDDWVGDSVDMTETNNLLSELIDVVASKNFSIDGETIGRASINYIQSETRRRGVGVI